MTIDPQALFKKYGTEKVRLAVDAERCERDLALFFQRGWQAFDPSPFVGAFFHDAIADHLMAVSDGQISKLLITIPPRHGKTNLISVAWPAWTWAQTKASGRMGPQVRFMCLSYSASMAMEIATTARRLIMSDWYTERWGERVKIAKDQDNKEKFDTTAGGSRISLGFGGGTPGRGGTIRIIDDPHKVDEVESEITRENVLQTYDEALSTRFNDPRSAAEVIVMQRLHQNDLAGHVLDKYSGHVHLNLPAEYDPTRHCVTVLGWEDPRGVDEDGERLRGVTADGGIIPGSPASHAEGKLLWPARYTREVIDNLKTALGPYAASAQLQQMPVPRGGGIIRPEWWKLWPGETFPAFRNVYVSVDTAPTEKEQNDEAAITVWGIFDHPDESQHGRPAVMLIDAWEGRLEISKLVAKVAEYCKKRSADVCMIEAKSNGIDVINEIRRIYGRREWSTIPIDPKGDKVARLLAVQPSFSGAFVPHAENGIASGAWEGGIVYAPDKDYAQLVIDRVAAFPKARHKGIVDTVSQFLNWARVNVLVTFEEHEEDLAEELRYKKPRRPVYDV